MLINFVMEREENGMTMPWAFKTLVRFFYLGIGRKDFRRDFDYTYRSGCITCGSRNHQLFQMISLDAAQTGVPESAWTEAQKALLHVSESRGWKGGIQIDTSEERISVELKGPGEAEYGAFREAVMSVFYIENPLCGELIYEGEDAVVCRRSDEQIPDDFPMASDYWTEGLLFAGTSMYAVPVPYVVSVTEYPRIAEAGEPADPLEVLRYAISLIDAESAEDILFSIRAKWNAEPDGEDGARWYSLVCALVDRIAASGQVKGHFRANTPCLICAGYVDRNDVDRARRREIAEQWLSQQRRYELVHEHFCLLGVPTMEVVCACRGGYAGTEYDNTEGIC